MRTTLPRLRRTAPLGLVSAVSILITTVPTARAAAAESAPVISASAYTLTSAATGMCLGSQWANTANLTPIVQQPCQGLLNQRWVLTSSGSGTYTIADESGNNACLNVQGGATTAGALLIDYTCDGGANEQFTLSTAPDGATVIHPQNAALCLDLPHGAATANLQIQQYSCDGGSNQEWQLTRADPLVFTNPGFEQGTTGWTFTAGAGIGTNNPHSGSDDAYLNAGTGYDISQATTAPEAGSYDFSAWLASSAAGGTLSVSVNGTSAGSLTLLAQTTYAKYTLSRIQVAAGDTVTLTVGSSPGGWVNADDIEVAPSAPNDPQITSSNATITAMFDWAKAKANSWVRQPGATGPINADENHTGGTGTALYSNTYWAGYPYRSDFYSRDFAHQMVGAHLLGLDADNKTMLRAFAASATSAQGYYPDWSINFDAATPGSIDYTSPTDFVRELPAPFELAQRISDAYAWTGDSDYLNDPTLSTYVTDTVGPFISQHTGPVNNGTVPVAEADSSNITQGVASYNENTSTPLAEAGDSIASQYQAYLAAAALATAKGDTTDATTYTNDATTLKNYYNTTWSVDPGNASNVVRAYDTNGNQYTDWGAENSWFMPLKGIMNPGTRETSYLSYIDSQASGPNGPSNLEADTYLPDVFFAQNQGATAWKWMQYIYSQVGAAHSGGFLNGDYPEVAFTLLSQTVQGMLGITPDAAGQALTTASQLPSDIGWLQVASIPIGNGTVTLRHDGQTRSTLANTSASGTFTWTAEFAGTHTGITVDGATRTAQTTTVNGTTYTYATVSVPVGQTAVVAVTG